MSEELDKTGEVLAEKREASAGTPARGVGGWEMARGEKRRVTYTGRSSGTADGPLL